MNIPSEPLITDLEALVEHLPAVQKAQFSRIYELSTTVGEVSLPPALEPWVEKQFGSLDAIRRQKIVRLYNRVSQEEVFINEQRAARPIESQNGSTLAQELAKANQNDVFANPEHTTSEDIFGRIKGKYCITAGNITKTDAYHGVIIFNDFNPLDFTCEQITDYIETGREWARRINRLRPDAKYFLLFWNCLWRAGATQIHGHAQVMLATGTHYLKIESLRKAALEYQQTYGANYFDDLFEVHRALGCAFEKDGVRILSYLTPVKFYEVMLLSNSLNACFEEKIYELLAVFRDKLNVTTFNFGLITPPLSTTPESWAGFPNIARIIDRGPYELKFADVGSFELFGATMVSNDPFKLARKIRGAF